MAADVLLLSLQKQREENRGMHRREKEDKRERGEDDQEVDQGIYENAMVYTERHRKKINFFFFFFECKIGLWHRPPNCRLLT